MTQKSHQLWISDLGAAAIGACPDDWQLVFRRAPAMMHSVNEEGRLVEVSDKWLEMLGYERDEVIGRLTGEFLTNESRLYSHEVIYPSFFRTGRIVRQPQELRRSDGSVIEVEIDAEVLRDFGDGRLLCIAVLTQVGQRNEAQRLLAAREAYYSLTLTMVPDPILRALPDTTITFCNVAYCRHHGLGEHELVGRRVLDLVPAPLSETIKAHRETLTPERPVAHWEGDYVEPDGSVRWMSWVDRAIFDEHGHMVEVFTVGRDITEAKLRDERLRAQADSLWRMNERLTAANEGLRQFGRVLSHDIQEPLRKIAGYAEMLDWAYGQNDVERVRKAAHMVLDTVRRASRMVGDLLADSRLAELEPQPEWISLGAEIAAVAEIHAGDLTRSGAQVEIAIPGETKVFADRRHVDQIFRNLLSNAVKYSDPGRRNEIRIAARAEAGGALAITVSDRGIGFDPADAERMFEPGSRLDNGLQTEGKGMGLAICSTAARRLGWQIRATGRLGGGSSFTVTIPGRQMQGNPQPDPSISRPTADPEP